VVSQACLECFYAARWILGLGALNQKADLMDLRWLLRFGGERRGEEAKGDDY
jgi:hypothetical protein